MIWQGCLSVDFLFLQTRPKFAVWGGFRFHGMFLVTWISAGQCFLMEANGRPGAWFVLQLPASDDYPAANKRKGGAKATASAPLPRATMLGPYTSPRFAGASKYMLAFCKACCPRLAIEVPLGDPLSRFRLAYWLDQGFVPEARAGFGGAVRLATHK